MSEPAQYRVEHRDESRQPCRSTVVAAIGAAKPQHRTLDPFVSLLIRQGRVGTVVLVDEATDQVVARRRIVWPTRG